MQNKILIFGNGWIGNVLKDYFGDKAELCKHHDENHDIEKVTAIDNKFDVVINTAGKTNIDWCEQNKLETFRCNVLGALNLAKICKEQNKKYVFFSSACIFESKNSKDIKYETSRPNPQCFYSMTKAWAEDLILKINPDTLIIRPRLPLSEQSHPRNTINKLLKYDKINDNQESVTVVEDMLPVLDRLIKENANGIFHLMNEGTVSPAEIAMSLGHTFETVTKKSQDERLAKENRAKRVTVFGGSKRIPMLPNIRERLPSLISQFKLSQQLQ